MVKYPLSFVFSYFQLITRQYESPIIWKEPMQFIKIMNDFHYKMTPVELKWSILYTSFNLLHSSMNQLKKTAIKVATIKIMDDLHYKRKPFCATN